MRAMRFTLAALLLAATAAPSQAATILYDNGAINGSNLLSPTIGITSTGLVSNSFSLTGPSTLSSVELGVWVDQGATPVQLNWAIGTTAFGSEKGSGSSALASSLNNNVLGLFDVFKSTFTINGTLAAGTYWLTLSNATATNQGNVYWDMNSGASQAFTQNTMSPIASESFKILGDPVRTPPTGPAVPEPTSLALAGFAGIGMAVRALRRRRLQDQTAA